MNPIKQIKRAVVAVTGGTVLVVGVAMIVLPGPAFIVIPAGLGILAIEFSWAKRWLQKAREMWPRNKNADADGTAADQCSLNKPDPP